MNKATVTTPDGATVTVDFDAIQLPEGYQIANGDSVPDGYVRQEVVNSTIEKRLLRHKESLKKDPEYVRELIEYNVPGIRFGDDGKPVLPKSSNDTDINELRKQIQAELVFPVKSELEKVLQSNSKLLESKRRSEIMQAAINHGVQDHLLKPSAKTPGAPSFWENMVSGQYGYADDYGVFAVRNGESFALNPNGTAELPLLDIDSHVALLKKDPQYAQFFKVEGQKGSGFQQNGGSNVAGGVSRDQFSNGQISADQLEAIASGKIKVAL